MNLSTHYYVLCLSSLKSTLFEAFRDSLIEIENHGFPVLAPAGTSSPDAGKELLGHARNVDRCFGNNFRLEPLRMVVVGEMEIQSAFSSITEHGNGIIGRIEGDHTDTRARDLGRIAWPLVKEAMTRVLDRAFLKLEASSERGDTASGMEAVVRMVKKGLRATLLVEDGYHMRGSIGGTNHSPVISPEVDVREANDDAVDVVIEKVLEAGGNVIFTPSGSLNERNRIVLLPYGAGAV